MKTCLNTITVGGDKPLENTLDLLGKYRYDGVELEYGRIEDYLTRRSMDDLKKQLQENHLQVAALMAFPFFAFDTVQQEQHLPLVERYGKMAAELGSDTLLCFICDAPPAGMSAADAMAVAGRAAQRYGEAAGESGVKCALEAIGMSPFMPGPRQALAVAGASGSSKVGVMIDTFHYYKSGVDIEDIRAIPKGKLLIVHINDCPDMRRDEMADSHRVYPGSGDMPLLEQLQVLDKHIGYEGFLSIELFNPSYWADDPDNVVRKSKEGLDALLAQL